MNDTAQESPWAVPQLRYRAGELIGRGGSSDVFRAIDPDLGRTVALKVQRDDDYACDAQSFVAEARLMARLDHPAIATIYALGRDLDGRLCIAMRELPGRTLSETILTDEAWPSEAYFERLASVLVRVADALQSAHERGIVHRDVKPDNVLVGEGGEAYLLDWGLAGDAPDPTAPVSDREQHAGAWHVSGTPAFMAPEQAEGRMDRVDARSDVFGLGATLYFGLTRRPPYPGENPIQVLAAARAGDYPAPASVHPEVTLPPALEAIALRAMAIDPNDRYASIAALKADLVRYLQETDPVAVVGASGSSPGHAARCRARVPWGTRRAGADNRLFLHALGPGVKRAAGTRHGCSTLPVYGTSDPADRSRVADGGARLGRVRSRRRYEQRPDHRACG